MSPNVFHMLYQTHAHSWFWILLFSVISFVFIKKEKTKLQKVTRVLLRLVSAIMIVTGIAMLVTLHFPLAYVVKGIVAICMIGVIELILIRASKGIQTGPYWGLFILLLVLVLLLAFKVISF
ncbi:MULTISPECIES: DUF1516 family protein [Aneurinibacillus]|uniref:DUF1516 family protein n=1 Tax=Aneurinibacillus thermoaerophilus TaxID=143495 RepID=A0A1G7YXD7_ANETH|nr:MULTISPECIES: DUF1516 family protein [Aneurinibacillus]AMA73161.1 hypothetical protein ACH33_10020 [Aneurinibacillus sp. XH2]MED0674419.1 DUF1516 family protein [Aneurinibacillus thermoaerophilus]MED0678436.1 DUF1516 family protein [Aneurinibacillus thermoaerophilus]MED0736040.1 DUF1516 family protein [Aneurinibacillus thermoaerophilus]MED0758956.1 DUF1516 family protein [Aneurinibacillus thermoaerophilus]